MRYLESIPVISQQLPNGKILKRELLTRNGSEEERDPERAGYTARREEK